MAAQYRSHTTASSEDGTYTISRPTGVTAGDVLVLVVATDTGSVNDITVPSGWTVAVSQQSSQEYTRVRAFTKTATGSEPSSYQIDYEGYSSAAVLVAVQDATLPGVYNSSSAGSGTTSPPPASPPPRRRASKSDSPRRTATVIAAPSHHRRGTPSSRTCKTRGSPT